MAGEKQDMTQEESTALDTALDAVYGDDTTSSREESPTLPDAPQPKPSQASEEGTTSETDAEDENESAVAPEPGPDETPDGETSEESPSSEPGPAGDDEVERLRQQLRTMEGRLKAANDQVTELRDKKPATPPDATPNATEKPAVVEIPESLASDAAEFDSLYPDLSQALRLAGAVGDRARRLLRDAGPDMAALCLDQAMLRSQMDKGIKGVEAKTEARTRQEHLERIASAHPEMRGFVTGDPGDVQTSQAYLAGVKTWVESLPYKAALDRVAVLQKGSASQVNALLTEYKQQAKSPKTVIDPAARRRAQAAEGVDSNRTTRLATDRDSAKAGVKAAYDVVYGDA